MTNAMTKARSPRCIGAVIDVEFPRERMPADLRRAEARRHADLTLEVQQQLGDGVVRTIAMGSSEACKRGMAVTNTGAPISVPVGAGTLGPHHGRARPPA